MLIYLLKSAACLAILLLFYKLFLEKENMHIFKRFYLLGSLLFALIVPTLVFSEYVVVEPQVYEAPTQAIALESSTNIPYALESDVTDIAPLLWIVYFLGTFFFGMKFLRNLFQIYRRIRRNPKFKNASFIQVLLQEKIPPHTFFKYIFLNKSKFESKEIPEEVLLHEETHAREKHSLDVVFIELLQVIFWVNPLIYFFKKAIKLNHEFLADSAVLNKNVDPVTYQNTLLSFLSSESAKKYQPMLPNAINYSSIKKRFTIMKSKTSKKSVLLRSFLLLPLLAMLLAGFTETKLIEVTAPVVEKTFESEIIQILVNNKGQLLINEKLVALEDLDSFLVKRNENLLNEQGTKTLRAYIIVEEKSPLEVITDIERILNEYGVAQIDIIGPEIMTLPSLIQKGATKEQVSKYNALAKKYNAIPKVDRAIPLEDLKILEQVFRKMTDSQKKKVQPFPECLPKNIQDGASRELMKEYNALAKEYNTMLSKSKNIQIKMKDVKRLEYIYGLMSDKQRADAERFPDFPPMPDSPAAPKALKEAKAPKVKKGDKSDIPPPPPPTAYVDVPVSPEKATKRLREDLKTKSPSEEIIVVPDSPKRLAGSPPPPPAPKSPLDHVIEMAKKGATFYHDEKEITSDEAIKILKKNKEINIETKRIKSKKPVVKLSTKPIKIGSTYNILKKTKLNTNNNLQKVALVTLQSNETIERNKIGMRLKEFSKSFRKCKEFYFDGLRISKKEAVRIYVNDPEIEISQDDSGIVGLAAKC